MLIKNIPRKTIVEIRKPPRSRPRLYFITMARAAATKPITAALNPLRPLITILFSLNSLNSKTTDRMRIIQGVIRPAMNLRLKGHPGILPLLTSYLPEPPLSQSAELLPGRHRSQIDLSWQIPDKVLVMATFKHPIWKHNYYAYI